MILVKDILRMSLWFRMHENNVLVALLSVIWFLGMTFDIDQYERLNVDLFLVVIP